MATLPGLRDLGQLQVYTVTSMEPEMKYARKLRLEQLKLEEAKEDLQRENIEDIAIQLQRINDSITKLLKAKDETMEQLLEGEKSFEKISEWSRQQRLEMDEFCKVRNAMKRVLEAAKHHETESNIQAQRKLDEELAKLRIQRQKEEEEAILRQQKLEQDWMEKKLQLQTQLNERGITQQQGTTASSMVSAVKLQKYTITPFKGDYVDWLRFWNQFTVEVDNSAIAEISKFNYLMELVQDGPREDILGLPHTEEGYKEAKRILNEKYGKDIKVHKALIKEMESLKPINSIHHLKSIHQFYNKLSRIVRTLKTMGKISSAQSAVYSLSDKLGPVRELLAQNDDNWENWSLEDLVESLRKYTDRNPMKEREEDRDVSSRRNRDYSQRHDSMNSTNTKLLISKPQHGCAYCDSTEHTSLKCRKVLNTAARREILRKKRACFNCTAIGHQGAQCRSRGCFSCGEKHHTSICNQQPKSTIYQEANTEKGMSNTIGQTGALHPSLNATIENEPVRIMIDTGASSSYICTEVITKLNLKPIRCEQRNIEQMYGTMRKIVEIYKVTLGSNVDNDFSLEIECINAEKEILTFLPNPNIRSVKDKIPRLRRIDFSDEETSSKNVPIHVILGVGDYQRIRTSEPIIFGNKLDTDPVAEYTKLGWTLFGGKNCAETTDEQFLIRTGQEEFERMCSLDVLGLTDPIPNREFSHEEFKDQITYNASGFYETGLPWKKNCAPLLENKEQTRARLSFVTKKLIKIGKLQEYHTVMREQIDNGILEPVPEKPTGETVHYIPHQPLLEKRQNQQSYA